MNRFSTLFSSFRNGRQAQAIAFLAILALVLTSAIVAAQPSSSALATGSFSANGGAVTLSFGKPVANLPVSFYQSADRKVDSRDLLLGSVVLSNASIPQTFVLGRDLDLPNDAGDAVEADGDYFILARSSAGVLPLVGLYQYAGGSIFVHGSEGADVVTASDSGDKVFVALDETVYTFASDSFKMFYIRTHGGADRVDLSGVVGHRGLTAAWAVDTLRSLGDATIDALLDAGASPMDLGVALVKRAVALQGGPADSLQETIGDASYKAIEAVDCSLFANAGAINGGPGPDVLTGTADNDKIFGNGDDDILSGLGGCDRLNGGDGDDTLDGGDDKDWAMYDDSPSRVIVDLTGALPTTDGWGTTDSLVLGTLENIWGSAFNDRLIGDTADNRIIGDAGNDTMLGNIGDGWLQGGSGVDNIRGNDGNDLIQGDDGNDIIQGQNDDDAIFGGDGDDNMIGGPGYDDMAGGLGNDFMNGHANDDIMSGGWGDDIMWGQGGSDRLDGNEDDDTLYGVDDTCADDLAEDRLHGNVGADTAYAAVASAAPDNVLASVETTIACP